MSSVALTEEEELLVGSALSLIWTKMNFQLKNIAITNKMGIISYGARRSDKFTVNLKTSTHILTEQVGSYNKYFKLSIFYIILKFCKLNIIFIEFC